MKREHIRFGSPALSLFALKLALGNERIKARIRELPFTEKMHPTMD